MGAPYKEAFPVICGMARSIEYSMVKGPKCLTPPIFCPNFFACSALMAVCGAATAVLIIIWLVSYSYGFSDTPRFFRSAELYGGCITLNTMSLKVVVILEIVVI